MYSKESKEASSSIHLLDLTSEGVTTSGLGWSHHVPFGVLNDKIGNLVEEHGAEVILLQKVVRCQPGVVCHIVRQLHGWPSLIHINAEDVIILLHAGGGETDINDSSYATSRLLTLSL